MGSEMCIRDRAAGIKCGTEINLICDGEDEEAAMEALSAAIESGLGEN